MTDYTIVKPGFEFIPPPEQGKELEFLELATRTCYKSEDRIGPGTAEKLMSKVVKEYEHYSVTEHANCVLLLEVDHSTRLSAIIDLLDGNPLFASRISEHHHGFLLVSGNVRMWMDWFKYMQEHQIEWGLHHGLKIALHKKWPFFFEDTYEYNPDQDELPMTVLVLDENPITNRAKLSKEEIKKHMTLTYRLIGDRTMSHQLVRHRLFAFSQESQRYCNYGKKGFQFVIPPSCNQPALEQVFIDRNLTAYKHYLEMMELGLKPEDARGLLPNCCKTEVVTTGTLGYWIDHIFPHRALNPKAQWQIRGIMLGIREHMMTILPELF